MNINKILDRFSGRRVLVLGDVFIDEYLNGECSRISPEAPVPILRVTSSFQVLGGAANTAANVASLGGRPILIGLLGDDEPGREFRVAAKNLGIELRTLTDGRPTTRKARLVGQRQQLIRLDYEETHYVESETVEGILALVRAELNATEIVILSDYAKGFFTEKLCRIIIAEAHAAGKKVIVDPRPQHGHFYLGADYLTPNWKESLGLAGLPGMAEKAVDPDAILAVGATISNKSGGNVLLTLGSSGMAFFGRKGQEQFSLPTVTREVFDVSGAGDTVVACFALALAAECDHRESAFVANLAAGIVVGKFGTATVTREELLRVGEEPSRRIRLNEAKVWARRWKAKGRRIAVVLGTFTSLEPDHVKRIEESKRNSDLLVVGLVGSGESEISDARVEMLLSLRAVDFVCPIGVAEVTDLLADLTPEILVDFQLHSEQFTFQKSTAF